MQGKIKRPRPNPEEVILGLAQAPERGEKAPGKRTRKRKGEGATQAQASPGAGQDAGEARPQAAEKLLEHYQALGRE